MAAKKLEFPTNCRIGPYVEAVNEELSKLLRHTCVEGALNPRPPKTGVTFLLPEDPAYIAEIGKLARSTKPEDATKAAEMLSALIIPEPLKSISDWTARSKEIPNSLYPPQNIGPIEVKGNTIMFPGGATATLDLAFADSSRRSNLAVWKLTGRIPVTTDKVVKLMRKPMAKGAKGAKMGAYVPPQALADLLTFMIGIAVENAYLRAEVERRSTGAKCNDTYLRYSMSLAKHILSTNPTLFYDRVLPVLAYDNLDFYILVEPHREDRDGALIPENIIREWWASAQNVVPSFNVANAVAEFNALLTAKTDGPLVYSGRSELDGLRDALRGQLTDKAYASARNSAKSVIEKYQEVIASNRLPDTNTPIFPEDLAAWYAQDPTLKVIHDELRFRLHIAFRQFETSPLDVSRYKQLIDTIGDCLHADPSRDKNLLVLNVNTIVSLINPVERVDAVITFINSCAFLFTPCTRGEASIRENSSKRVPPPGEDVYYNFQAAIYDLVAVMNNPTHPRLVPSVDDAIAHIASANLSGEQRARALAAIGPATQ